MNKFILTASIVLMASSSFAAAKKVCFGAKNNDDTNGVVLETVINKKQIYIKTVKQGNGGQFGDGYYDGGSYKSLNETVKGRDGKTYLSFDGEDTDYHDVILVDKELLKAGTSGLLQIRARGEGFFNSVFFCKDSK